ncbi:MAG: hypothetical protein R2802_04480 [Flavobacteriaceae bacterium]|nr:hypothetical protein [Mangrovimonas sp.]
MKKGFLFLCLLTALLCCKQSDERYYSESPEIEYTKTLLSYYSTFNFGGIKSIYSDSVKIYENSLESYNVEKLLATLKSDESKIEYQRLEDSLHVEMIVNDKNETWVYGWYLWKIKYDNNTKEYKVPVQSSWQFLNNKIIKEYTYYDASIFYSRYDSIRISNN